MANTVTSPNMNLPVPVVSVDPGPDWATNLNSCLSDIDSHNHTPGQGVQITPAGININTDLPINGNNLTTARSLRFSAQASPLATASDKGCIYESGVDLYYNDGSGNQIRLTQSGSPAGATGTITGLPSGTASASFSGTTFTFQSSTNTPASMNLGPTKIAQAVASGFGVTISAAGAQAGDYALTLPTALPSNQSYVISDSSGNLSFLFNGANIRASEGAGTTTLTSADNFWQVFSLSAARTVKLPSTNIVKGMRFTMGNVGNGALTVQSSGSNTIGIVDSAYAKLELVALADAPSTAANWSANLSYSQSSYSDGTSYNGGNAPTISTSTGTISSVNSSRFIPYQLLDGSWRLKFDFNVTLNASTRSSMSYTVNGVTFPAAVPFSVYIDNGGAILPVTGAITDSPNFSVFMSSVACRTSGMAGDVPITAKPSWAY